jgi:DNA polymerase III sliding clamp (beta) subunit (PCNA family)
MHLTIDQSVLARELALVAAAAETRSSRSLSRVRVEARDNGTLRLTANNLEFGLASKVAAQVTEPGVICVPAKQFL